MKRKVFSILLSLCMLITMVPFMAAYSFATDPIDYFYIKNEDDSSIVVDFCKNGIPDLPADVHLQWTTDPSGSWNAIIIESDATITPVTELSNKGDKVYFRCGNDPGVYNNHQLSKQDDGTISFNIHGDFSAGGDIRSLVTSPDETNLNGTTSIGNYAFYGLFEGADDMVSYEGDLNIQTIGKEACSSMFFDCENLKRAPNINSNTVGYRACVQMFSRCTSLEDAPNLLAINLNNNCYDSMFDGCTSLKTPPELPAPEVPFSGYYNMFDGCTALEYIPELPATKTGNEAYYGMFKGCTQFKICDNRYGEKCSKVFRMPGSGAMTQIGSNFSKNMFADTSGIVAPSANTTYYYEINADHEWTYNWHDANMHLKICSACGDKKIENHPFGEPVISGVLKISECSACGYNKIEAAPAPIPTPVGPTEIDKLKEEVKKLEEEIKNITTPPTKVKPTLVAGKNLIKISWKKVEGATHYQIYYKRSSASSKIITVAAENSSKTIKSLRSGKKYMVKVRGVKKKNKTVTYGKWSASKTVKVK